MKPKPHILLCTVGTSLFDGNLRQIDRLSSPPPNAAALKHTFQGSRWGELATLDPTARCCAAGINTLAQLHQHPALASAVSFNFGPSHGKDSSRIFAPLLAASSLLESCTWEQ